MMKSLFIFTFLSFLTISCNSQTKDASLQRNYLKDSLSVIQKRIAKRIIPTRYMEGKLISTTDTLKGWKGIKVSLYQYSVDNGKLTARIYMANADAKKLAEWVITTCVNLTDNLSKENTDFLIKSMMTASGGQFAVKGYVYENMDGKGYYPYVFRDGLTVYLTKNTKDKTDLSLITYKNIKGTGQYARIISTTRQQYNALFPKTDTKGQNWLKVIRKEYKAALSSNKNNLMIAWAKGKLKPTVLNDYEK